jgi:putative ABC transport system permease protein
MSTGSVGRAVRGGLSRRRVQAIVIGLVTLVSTAASALALALVIDSNAPFDRSFAAQRGADVTATVSLKHATRAELEASTRIPGVVAAAGPFSQLSATLELWANGPGAHGAPVEMTLPPLTLAGRNAPGGPVDDLVLQAGHWVTGPGQIVLASRSAAGDLSGILTVGEHITVASAPGKPLLTIVGIASSITGSADGWVTSGDLARLAGSTGTTSAQMLYRFSSAGSPAAIHADVARLTTHLPRGTITGTQSYLSARFDETSGIATIAPFVAAFGVIGLVMSVLIVVNVITGAVVSGYRRIGVLKSIGFTPGQVVTAYVMQALIPAAVGCLAGLLAGNVLAGALLRRTAQVYQVGALAVPAWVNLAVPIAMLGLVGIAAVLPAARAGRLSAVQAIAAGRAPRQGAGYAAHRLLGRIALPRPVTIGLAAPFARPARTAVTLLAVLLGAAAVTFAVGLGGSLSRVQLDLSHSNEEPVQVSLPSGPGPGGNGVGGIVVPAGGHHRHRHGVGKPALPAPAEQPTVASAERTAIAAIRAQAGTLHYVGETDDQVTVTGLTKQVQVTAFQGNASWIGYEMISGRWYTGPGQVDVPTYFLTVTGKTIGDNVTFTFGGKLVTAKIVGEVFDTSNRGLAMFTDYQTLARADASLAQPAQYDIGLRPGTSPTAYADAIGRALGPAYVVNMNGNGNGLLILLGLIGLLTLMLAIVAGLGVLNAVVLQTREKVHDLGVFKAVGMAPAQTIAMVVSWVAGIGLVAGLVAVPAGIALQHNVVPVMAHAAGTNLPAVILNAFSTPEIAVLALAGLAIAVAGALAPAGWAAGTRTATALRAE